MTQFVCINISFIHYSYNGNSDLTLVCTGKLLEGYMLVATAAAAAVAVVAKAT